MQFNQAAKESLRYYVYGLIDPSINGALSDRIFYIGKGIGDRCFQHANEEVAWDESSGEKTKLSKIRAIRIDTGQPPQVTAIAHDLYEMEALRLQAVLIGSIGGLTNAVSGHNAREFWLSPQDVNARSASPIQKSELPGVTLFVSLNGGGRDKLPPFPLIADDPQVLKTRVVGRWPVSEARARTIQYIAGVYRGLIRVVFRTEIDTKGFSRYSMIPRLERRMRDRFIWQAELDEVQTELLYRREVSDDDGKVLTKMPSGASCRYVDPNCSAVKFRLADRGFS